MSIRLSRILIPVACLSLLWPAWLSMSHEDDRLNSALKKDDASRRQFELAMLSAQLAGAHAKLGDTENAAKLAEVTSRARSAISDSYVMQSVAGDTANEISSRDFEQARKLHDGIKETELWVKTAWKLARRSKKEVANELLSECERRARTVEDLELRAELISGTGANFKNVDPARASALVYESYGLAQVLKEPYDSAIMLNEVGAHLMDIGDKDRAIAVFDMVGVLVDKIKDPLEQAKALAMLGGEQAEKGLRDRAAAALERGVKAASAIPDGEEKWAVTSEIARNLGQSYKFERGIEVAEKIPDLYHQQEGFIRVAKNMSRHEKKAESIQLLARVAKNAEKIESPYFKGVVLRKVISEYVELKMNDEAKALLEPARKCVYALEK